MGECDSQETLFTDSYILKERECVCMRVCVRVKMSERELGRESVRE